MLLAMVAALGLLQQPEPEKVEGGRFLPEIGIPELYEEPGYRGRAPRVRLSGRLLQRELPVAPPPRPVAPKAQIETDYYKPWENVR